ncbi:hypothetical protein G3I55_50430, partial [Streptomyces sp. SID6648]|nr:hypothetical protein [Streptomyces sp. SID6648]
SDLAAAAHVDHAFAPDGEGAALNLGAGGAATLSAGAATTISGTVNVQINSVMTRIIGATLEAKTPIFKVATIPVPGL